MRCDEFEAKWQDLLDQRQPLESAPELAAHAAECEQCGAEWRLLGQGPFQPKSRTGVAPTLGSLGRTLEAVRASLAAPAPPETLLAPATAQHAPAPGARRASRGWWRIGVVALVSLLAVGLAMRHGRTPAPSPGPVLDRGARGPSPTDLVDNSAPTPTGLPDGGLGDPDAVSRTINSYRTGLENVRQPFANSIGRTVSAIRVTFPLPVARQDSPPANESSYWQARSLAWA